MCGILGTIGPDSPIQVGAVVRALTTLRHRGPDDEGYAILGLSQESMEVFGGVDTPSSLPLRKLRTNDEAPAKLALGHRRLSILDLSDAGHQPMCDPAGRYWLIFNGEIYNYLELRSALEREGQSFHTKTDSEVLLTAWRTWGQEALSRVRGMFAFAVVDLGTRTLTLARDQLGIKPLYWTQNGGRFAFASEIKAILALPGLSARADAEELYRFLRFGCTEVDERSCFAGVQQLRPGHVMQVSIDNAKVIDCRAYWKHEIAPASTVGLPALSMQLTELMRESVHLHLRSDVPVGSCFSGGLDSSLIVALARRELGPGHRWTGVCFDNGIEGSSDAPYAQSLREQLGLNVELVAPSAAQLAADLDDLVYHQDVPFDSTSIYAQYAVFRRARECGLTVMLDGQGADEMFGGYPTSISAKICEALWAGDIAGARMLANGDTYPDAATRRRMLLAALGRMAPLSLTGPLLKIIGEPLMLPEMNPSWFLERGVHPRRRPEGRGRNALREELAIQVTSWSLPHLLRYEDRNSMAFSIEARVPFCTPEVAEFAAAVPSEHLISRVGVTKAVLRAAAIRDLPSFVINRTKIGFKTDESAWLRGAAPVLQAELESDRLDGMGPFKSEIARARVTEALSGRRGVSPSTWRVLMVAMWARRFGVAFD